MEEQLTPSPPKIHPQFVIKLREKEYVLVAGLLDLGHRTGLRSIETEMVQMPATENGQTALCRAIGRFVGPDGDAIWSAYGDASPANTKLAALPRVAETRAVARMLRMACNVAACAVEELPDDEANDGNERSAMDSRQQNQRSPANGVVGKRSMGAQPGNGSPASRGLVDAAKEPIYSEPIVLDPKKHHANDKSAASDKACKVCGEPLSRNECISTEKHGWSDLLCYLHRSQLIAGVGG